MKHSEGAFRGAGGVELYYQSWHQEGKPRGILVIVHGVGEHSGRYMNLVSHLSSHGYAVYGFDQRGFGRSPGQRGYINSWVEYREDLKAFLQRIREQQPDCAIFLFGHSMGALVVLDYILHYSEGLRGAIVSGSPIEPAGVAKPHLVVLAHFLSRVWPRFTLPLGLDASALSRDAAVVKAYTTDPLVHGHGTARWGTESLAAVARVKDHASDVSIPILMLHGEADRLSLASGSRHLFEAVTCPDKTLRIYPGTYHEPHNDINYDQVINDIERWLEQHL